MHVPHVDVQRWPPMRRCILLGFFLLSAFPSFAFVPYKGATKLAFRNASPAPLERSTVCYLETRARRRRKRRRWEDMIPRLRDYQEVFGNTNVAATNDPELYDWVRKLRNNYAYQVQNVTDHTGKRPRLSEEKLQVLKELNFSWDTKRGSRWQRLLRKLKAFQSEYGHTYVDFDHKDGELYKWTKHLRYTYRHQALNVTTSHARRPRLADSKMKDLNDLGFDWEMKRSCSRWEDMFPKLVAYKEKHGHTIVEESDDPDLYRWTTHLVKSYGPQLSNSTTSRWHRQLSEKRLQELRDINFTWKSRSSMWTTQFEALRAFRREHGHCHPTAREHPKLANFVQNQRQQYRRHCAGLRTTLTPERIEALQQIKFNWARPHEVAWAERKGDLDVYGKDHGNANVPQRFAGNFQLGQWCMNQRTYYRMENDGTQTGLTKRRVRLLEDAEFQWSPKAARWHAMFERLQAYQEEHGHLDITVSDRANQDLRQWLNEQRHFKRNKQRGASLSPQRIELLESIPEFSWRKKRKGPSKGDWSDLFVAIREKGIAPGGKTKEHIFDGVPRFDDNVKTEWTEQELLALWNEEKDDDDENEASDPDKYEGEFFEDEESRMFLRL